MKRILFTTLIFALSTVLFAQNNKYALSLKVDTVLFDKINSYRVYNNVSTLEWDNEVYDMTKYHTTYQTLLNKVTHRETIDVENFEEIETLGERFNRFVISREEYCAENARGGESVIVIDSTTHFAKLIKTVWNKSICELDKFEIMTMYTVYRWDQSPPHKITMLTETCDFGAVNIQYKDLKVIENSIFHNGKKIIRFISYSTSNFAK